MRSTTYLTRSILSQHSPRAYAVALTSTDTSDDKNCVTRTVRGKTQNGETYFGLWCAMFLNSSMIPG